MGTPLAVPFQDRSASSKYRNNKRVEVRIARYSSIISAGLWLWERLLGTQASWSNPAMGVGSFLPRRSARY